MVNHATHNVTALSGTVITESKSIEMTDHPSPGSVPLALSLLMSRVLTDNSDTTLSLDDLAFFANRFY